jgi:hypothetical protein
VGEIENYMSKNKKIEVKGTEITIVSLNDRDFICHTDFNNPEFGLTNTDSVMNR